MKPEQFKRLRKQLGYTQPQLSEVMKTPVATIKNWEGGHCRIPGAASKLIQTITNLLSK